MGILFQAAVINSPCTTGHRRSPLAHIQTTSPRSPVGVHGAADVQDHDRARAAQKPDGLRLQGWHVARQDQLGVLVLRQGLR